MFYFIFTKLNVEEWKNNQRFLSKKNPKTVDETEAPLNNQNTPIMYYLPFEQPKSYYITQA